MTERNFGQATNSFIAEVADVNDPHQAGRVRIRIYGRHDDRTNIPDSALPFAQVIQPVTSAANGRMGTAPVGLTVGSKVIGMWIDADQQLPVIHGTVGRAGDPIQGQTVNGAPAVDTATGSVPSSSQGIPSNPYSALNTNRVSIADIDSGQTDATSTNVTEGTVITVVVEAQMANATLPTTASADKENDDDVLDIVKAVDPLGRMSSIPCLNSSLLSVNSILDFLGGLVGNVISGITNTIVQGIRNALLGLAQKIGIFKLLGMLNSAISGVRSIQNLINALNVQVCGVNLINQGLFDTANYVMASVIGGLNTAVSGIVGGLNTVLNTATGAVTAAADAISDTANIALNSLVSSVASIPAAAVATITSSKPMDNFIAKEPPASYIQQYYSIDEDPYPGYIEWKDPSSPDLAPVYTSRDGQPNFLNAKQHTEYAASNHFTSTIGNALTSGQPLTFDVLTKAVSSSINFTQGFALAKVLGAGFSASSIIGLAAALIPTIASGVQSVFQPALAQSSYTADSSSEAMSGYLRTQAISQRQSTQMRAGLLSNSPPTIPPRSREELEEDARAILESANFWRERNAQRAAAGLPPFSSRFE